MLQVGKLQVLRCIFFIHCIFVVPVLFSGCANVAPMAGVGPAEPTAASWMPTNPPAGFFVPEGFFSKGAGGKKPSVAELVPVLSTTVGRPYVRSTPAVSEVLLYASPSTFNYMASGGMDAGFYTRMWEVFLRKYKIPFQLVTSVERLEQMRSGVLLLPSTVALSEREKQAVLDFRAKGGGVLASWLTGVRDEKGAWQGFGFMETALDVKVVGHTEADEDDNFMNVHGDNPVTHNLPAGMRVWLERIKDWYPLRLVGRHDAAQIMDWSRTFIPGKPMSVIAFDERPQPSGVPSRSVVLGYPERLWLSSYPHFIEAIAHNALMWLLHQPDAFVSAWPHPYSSAFVMAVDSPDVIADVDLTFAKQLEVAGGRATYYVLTENAKKSAEVLNKIQARGHEVAFLGDRFKGFRDESSNVQAKRLDMMRSEFKDAGIAVGIAAGFHAPMESFDKNTEKLLKEKAFGHYVSFMDASDARLPFFAPDDASGAKAAKPVVVLPRTQSGPEDEERDSAIGIHGFLRELDLAEKMAGLSVVRIPNQTMLDQTDQDDFFKHLKARSQKMWLATGTQVAEWWRERDRVSARLEPGTTAPVLTVTVKGDMPLQHAASVWVNLPDSYSSLRLVARDKYPESPKIVSVDEWRAAVNLKGFLPGEYQWHLFFDPVVKDVAQ